MPMKVQNQLSMTNSSPCEEGPITDFFAFSCNDDVWLARNIVLAIPRMTGSCRWTTASTRVSCLLAGLFLRRQEFRPPARQSEDTKQSKGQSNHGPKLPAFAIILSKF